jgi:uncharacterized protein YndB with AHSA1/START domain
MAHQAPLNYVFYIAATPEKVWEGFVSQESNRIIFSGAELQADFKPGGSIAWVGPGPDGGFGMTMVLIGFWRWGRQKG